MHDLSKNQIMMAFAEKLPTTKEREVKGIRRKIFYIWNRIQIGNIPLMKAKEGRVSKTWREIRDLTNLGSQKTVPLISSDTKSNQILES